MATNSYSIANQKVVNTQLKHEIRLAQFFNSMIGTAKQTNITAGGQEAWKMSGSPINIINQFRNTGRREMIIPVLGRLLDYGQVGKEQVSGNEEEMSWFWQSVFIHLKRKGVLFPDIVDQEAIDWAAKVNDYKDVLIQWWADYEDMDIGLAYFEGFSKHITDTTNGLSKTKRYNPNFWCYRGGSSYRDFSYTPTFTYTAATYLTRITTAMGSVDDSADNSFDHYTLEAIAANIAYSRIKGWNVDGDECYPLVIHSLQARTLRQDTVWLDAQGRVAGKAAMFKNQIGRWGKIIVIENDKVARIPYYSGSTLNFYDYNEGSDDTANGRWQLAQRPPSDVGSVQNVACAILIGADSMNQGIYSDLAFKMKTVEDYGMVSGIAGQKFYGNARNDSYNEDLGGSSPTAPTDSLPCQSAIICTRVAQ